MVDPIKKHKIHFKKASLNDVGFLVFLRKLTMDDHLKRAGIVMSDVQHEMRVREHFEDSYLILLDDNAVGLLKLGVVNQCLHIRQFQILPQYQGRGIGNNVINIVKKKAREKKQAITLSVLHDNPAKALYLRAGFDIESTDELQHYMRLVVC